MLYLHFNQRLRFGLVVGGLRGRLYRWNKVETELTFADKQNITGHFMPAAVACLVNKLSPHFFA